MRDIRLLTLVGIFVFLAMGFSAPVMTVYLESLGASFAEISLILTSFSLTALLSSYAGGYLSDRLGRRKPLLLAGLALMALAYFWLGSVPTAQAAWPVRIVEGVGSGTYNALSLAMMGDLLEHSSNKGRSMGIYRGIGSAAFAVGAVAGGWLATRIATPSVFWAAGGFYAAAALVMFAVHEHLRAAPVAEKEPLGAPQGYPGLGLPALFLVGVFIWMASLGAMSSMWPNALKHLGYNQQTISSLWGLSALMEMPSMALTGAISDVTGRAPLLAAGAAGMTAVLIGYALVAQWLWALVGLQVLRGTSFGAYVANAMTYTTERAGPLARGSASGVFSATAGAGSLIGTLVAGFVVQGFGFTVLFGLCAVGTATAALCFFALHRNDRPKPA